VHQVWAAPVAGEQGHTAGQSTTGTGPEDRQPVVVDRELVGLLEEPPDGGVAVLDLGVWDRAANVEAWGHLLGEDAGTDRVSPYAAPARTPSLAGLPPTYIEVGDLDLFLDEDLRMAQRLADAGVPVELHEYPGAYHGFDQLAPRSDTAQAARRHRVTALRRALDISGTTT
jgi:acetyl esterase/lipase